MRDKVCELVGLSLTHQRGDTLVSDNVSWWLATLEVLARQRWSTTLGNSLTRTRWSLNQRTSSLAKPTQYDTSDRNIG